MQRLHEIKINNDKKKKEKGQKKAPVTHFVIIRLVPWKENDT